MPFHKLKKKKNMPRLLKINYKQKIETSPGTLLRSVKARFISRPFFFFFFLKMKINMIGEVYQINIIDAITFLLEARKWN